jgi:ribosome-binding protein aMBF1 (putative translation factor)
MLYQKKVISMTDDLERHIAEREKRAPGFTALVDAAVQRRAFAREMAEHRKKSGLSQTQVAARMETSASIVGRVESGADVRMSTLEKYVAALGFELELNARKPGANHRRRGHRNEPTENAAG